MWAVYKVIREVIISLAESIPSATTARLPDTNPTLIFKTERMALPRILILEALMIFLSRGPIAIYKNISSKNKTFRILGTGEIDN